MLIATGSGGRTPIANDLWAASAYRYIAPPGGALSADQGGLVLGTAVTIGVYRVATHLAVTMHPINALTMAQDARFISVQKSLSISSLANAVRRPVEAAFLGFRRDHLRHGQLLDRVHRQDRIIFNQPPSDLTGPIPLMPWEEHPRPGARRLGRGAPATRRFGDVHQLAPNDHMSVCNSLTLCSTTSSRYAW